MSKAIVTLATGVYLELWEIYARPAWQLFCDRHGYDLVVLTEPLDTSHRAVSRSIAWQKLICFEHPRLAGIDHLIWLDSDIVINPAAPDPFLSAKLEKINCCLEFDWGNDPKLLPLSRLWFSRQASNFRQQYPGFDFPGYSQLWGFGEVQVL